MSISDSNTPDDLKYVASHEWLKKQDDGDIVIGITDHAQNLLGDVVFVELPEIGAQVSADDEIAVVESVKAASDVYAPISGTVTKINEALLDNPEWVNEDPYGKAWFFVISPDNADDYDNLLSAQDYQQTL